MKKFDEIVILIWGYSNIKRQLLSLNVPGNKISSINKRLITISVFEEMEVREIALRFISDLCVSVGGWGFNLYVEAGTLLGIVRDKDIPWDADIESPLI